MARSASPAARRSTPSLEFHPLTPDRWSDLETLFGPRGACGGCWCMWWHLARSAFDAARGDGNRRALHLRVKGGAVPGILAYDDGRPVGWCAIEPRLSYAALGRSRTLAPVDDRPVWSVTCFFVVRGQRKRGLTGRLLAAAVAHAAASGARLIEGYPVEPRGGALADAWAWTGFLSVFRRAGFREVARRSPSRPIVRLEVGGRRPAGAGRKSPARTAARARRKS